MKAFTKYVALAAWLVLALTVSAADERKADKAPADREPATEQEFVAKALSCTTNEIKVAEMAQKHAASPEVKQFAQRIVATQTKVRDQLADKAKELKATVSTELDKDQRDAFDKLNKLEGAAWDKEFLRCFIHENEKALPVCEKWAKDAKDAKVRELAAQGVQSMRENLDQARKLEKTIK
jgi:putative membrane protein